MVTGRIEKYYKEVCLLEQPFVKDPDKTISDLITESIAKSVKTLLSAVSPVISLVKVLKEQEDFAAELCLL